MAAIVTVAAIGLAADLASKQWAWDTLQRRRPTKILPGVLHFEFAFNTGSAFGLLREVPWARWGFVAVTLVSIAYVLWLGFRWVGRGALAGVAIGLLLGGALGNLHDRLFRAMPMFDRTVRHGVVDFIVVFYAPHRRWPAFNVADALLVVGMGLLMIALFRLRARQAP